MRKNTDQVEVYNLPNIPGQSRQTGSVIPPACQWHGEAVLKGRYDFGKSLKLSDMTWKEIGTKINAPDAIPMYLKILNQLFL